MHHQRNRCVRILNDHAVLTQCVQCREDRPPREREDRPPRQYNGPRMGARGSAAPAINDAHAFPTLGN